jgi:hypothetical protein
VLDGREGESENERFDALVARLKVLPASDPRSRAAILARVRGRRQSPWRAAIVGAWQQSMPQLAAAAAVVAAIGAGYGARVLVEPAPATDIVASVGTTAPQVVPVSNDLSETRAVPTTFILEAPGANRVSLVGDFNGWNSSSTALTDPSNTGVWEVTVPLVPGRHTYKFLVNDSVWTVDPRMPQERDPDFGSLNSVILVTGKR